MDVVGSGKDRSQDAAFKVPKRGTPWFGQVYFKKETEPYMTVAVRSTGDRGPVTIAELNLKFIWDVVSRIKVGERGKAYVVDRNGYLVADPDIGLVLRKTQLAELAHVKAALGNEPHEDAALRSRDLTGTPVLAAWAPIESLDWMVFVEQPVAEVYAKLNASIVRTGLLLLAGLVVSAIVALVLARGMVRPIRTLSEGARRIGEGNLDQRIEVKTGDELEALADRFNRMSGQLKESYAGLERKVEERTSELKNSLEQQTAISEILRVISGSPTDVKPVLEAVAERAAHLCAATYARVLLIDGTRLDPIAGFQDGHPASDAELGGHGGGPARPHVAHRARRDRPPHDPRGRHRAAARARVSGRAFEHGDVRPARGARRAADARERRLRRHHPRADDRRDVSRRPGGAGRDVRAARPRSRSTTCACSTRRARRPGETDRDRRHPARDRGVADRRWSRC